MFSRSSCNSAMSNVFAYCVVIYCLYGSLWVLLHTFLIDISLKYSSSYPYVDRSVYTYKYFQILA